MAARIPDARLVTIPGGHLVHEQCPDEFVAEVHTFLEVWVTGMPDDGVVTAVSRSATHTFSKRSQQRIRLLIAQGVEGDAHRGATVKHRSRVRRGATTPNLRQVHLIHAELHDDLGAVGFAVGAGDLGENVTTRGIDLLGLPIGTRLHLGDVAVVEVTGLRNPCSQIDDFQRGLLKEVVGGGGHRPARIRFQLSMTAAPVRRHDVGGMEPPTGDPKEGPRCVTCC